MRRGDAWSEWDELQMVKSRVICVPVRGLF
jgi:hypothetical protein